MYALAVSLIIPFPDPNVKVIVEIVSDKVRKSVMMGIILAGMVAQLTVILRQDLSANNHYQRTYASVTLAFYTLIG